MYDITQEMIDDLKARLSINGLPTDKWTDEELTALLTQSAAVIGTQYVQGELNNEYTYDFNSEIYTTICYPVKTDDIHVQLNNEDITEHIEHVTSDGILTFDKQYTGKLCVSYNNQADNEIINDYICLVAIEMLKNNSSLGNISSITEGDLSITYDSNSTTRASLDNIANELRNMYGARVRLL